MMLANPRRMNLTLSICAHAFYALTAAVSRTAIGMAHWYKRSKASPVAGCACRRPHYLDITVY
jgi:hypothetical protein